MLRFFSRFHGESEEKEITYEEALRKVLGTCRDCDMTRDMLTRVNHIECRYSVIEVKDYGEMYEKYGLPMVLMAGYSNLTPEGVEYDDNGNRL